MRRTYRTLLNFAGAAGITLGLAGCADSLGTPASIEERVTLSSFNSCSDLEGYIEDQAVRDMQLQIDCMKDGGWCGGGYGRPELADAAGAASPSGPSAYTKTNTQVAGVDEADFVKNDGTRIFVLSGQKLRAVKSWPADQLSLASSLTIEGYPTQMYLDEQNRVVVFSSVYTKYDGFVEGGGAVGGGGVADIACARGIDGCGLYYGNTTKVTVVDVTDIAKLKIQSEYYLPGSYANSRRIASSVRVVLSDWFRWPDTVQFWPTSSDSSLYSDKSRWNAALDALKVQNEKLIRAQTLAQWLPATRRKLSDGTIRDLPYQCGDFYRSSAPVHMGLVTIATLNLDTQDVAPARTSIVGEVGQIYASTTSLYVASPHWWWWPQAGQQDWTYLHKFDLTDKSRAVYVASGGVAGHIVDQFSMDEDKGYFRIASTLSRRVADVAHPDNRWGTVQTSNRISVLNENSGRLAVIGESAEIAPGEQIYSSRFVGDKGFVVTFHQVDPLFTFDLSNPTAPRRVGELQVPGFSTYIHPLDANHLLTIGVYQPTASGGGTVNWSERRLQLSLFDVTDFANPRQAFTQLVGSAYGWSDATYDSKAFNYFPERNLLAIPFSDYQVSSPDPWGNFTSDVRVFQVDPASGIAPRGGLSMKDVYVLGGAPDWYYWYTPWVRRSVMASANGIDYVYAVSDSGIRSANLANLSVPLSTVIFPKEPVQ